MGWHGGCAYVEYHKSFNFLSGPTVVLGHNDDVQISITSECVFLFAALLPPGSMLSMTPMSGLTALSLLSVYGNLSCAWSATVYHFAPPRVRDMHGKAGNISRIAPN